MSAPTFEFFPPRDAERLPELATTASSFVQEAGARAFSVTYGAGGSTRQGTLQAVKAVQSATGKTTVPHLSCLSETRAELRAMIDGILAAGCNRIMVIRGDAPEDGNAAGEMQHALELMQLVSECAGDRLTQEVACYPETHPEADSPDSDLRYLKLKQEAGAQVAVSQLFFEAEVFLRFRDRCQQAGIHIELVPGIMPVVSLSGIERMATRCGSRVPEWLKEALHPLEDGSDEQRDLGAELLAGQCQQLLDEGVGRIHFYSLNRLQPSLQLCQRLSWRNGSAR